MQPIGSQEKSNAVSKVYEHCDLEIALVVYGASKQTIQHLIEQNWEGK